MTDTDKMSIKEMAKFMFEKSNSANVEPVFTTNEGQEIVLGQDLTKLLNDVLEQAFIPFLAEALYNEGYRKQREARYCADPNYRTLGNCGECGGDVTCLNNYKNDWINVTEKNPEDVYGMDREKISVLVCTKSGKVSESTRCAAYKFDKQKLQYVRTGDFYWSGSKNVTHWKPMPLPPHKSDPKQEELPL